MQDGFKTMESSLDNLFAAATFSDRGLVRKDNQDAVLSVPARGFFAVADGMGGGEGGALASKWTCEELAKAVEPAAGSAPASSPVALDKIKAALETAHSRIARYAAQLNYRSMGTTVALVAAADGVSARVLWVGDSRVYRLREGEVERLTDDHTLGFELSRAVAGSETAKAVSARRHPLAHVLTHAIGVDRKLEPETREIDLRPGDRFLVCTDGVHDLLEPEDLKRTLAAADVEAATAATAALVRERGAHDNFSMVCFELRRARQ